MKPGRRARSGRRAPAISSGLRLIGGDWRSRRVAFADAPGLRPTPDRVRETLFNWLAPRIAGARCLDLFAGTGALGLEALSRGAAHVQFVDNSRAAVDAIRTALTALGGTERATVVHGNALATTAERAEIVFIDPPFDAQLHAAALDAVTPQLRPNARIYLEYPAAEQATIEALLRDGYTILRARRAGSVGYCLAQPVADGEDDEPLT